VRLSTFNLYVDDYPETGETLVHNTFSGAYVVLDAETLAALRKLDRGEELSGHERELALDPDLHDPDVAVVVESRAAEEAEFRAWFERRRSKKKLDVIVCVNLACNFDCPYCLQAGVLDGSVMKEEVADQTAAWIAARAIEVGVDEVVLSFVGGEPLLHPKRIERIAGQIKAVVEPRGIRFRFGLITNGYFLDQAMVERLRPFGLFMAKVTLDGDETTHSKTRVSKKGEDTFRRIFDNVVAASRSIRIAIEGNYQDDTVHGFAPLVEELAAAGMAEQGVPLHFRPALAFIDSPADAGSGACTWSGSDTSMRVALHDHILRHGFPTPSVEDVGPCEFHDHQAFAIDQDGTILKCPGFLGHAEWGIGHVATGLGDRYQQMIRLNPQRECGGCAHRPNCGGGCVAAQWVALGRPEGVNCEHGYFESVKEEAAVRGYLLASSDTVKEALAAFPPPKVPIPRRESERGRAVRPASLRVLSA
jgi:uncharacterized protein